MSMRSYTPPSIRQPTPGPIHVHNTVQKLKKNICLPPPIKQSKPASVNSILLQSSSDFRHRSG